MIFEFVLVSLRVIYDEVILMPISYKMFPLYSTICNFPFFSFLIDWIEVLMVHRLMDMVDEEGFLDRGNLGRLTDVSLGPHST